MKAKRRLRILIPTLIIVLIAGVIGLTSYFIHLPDRISQHETLIFGQNRYTPGSQAAIRIVVRDSKNGAPLPDSKVKVSLKPIEGGRTELLFDGITDQNGTASILFQVPEVENQVQNLIVETRSLLGSDKIERPVTLEREYKILLTTDKPLYQPGQTIHIRALALSEFDMKPAADQEIELVIADGKGNKVFREKFLSSDYGVISSDFQLASLVNNGAYKITASLGDTISEKTVTVEHYTLPKFDITLQTERNYYLPGEKVSGQLSVDYFFGKPVSDGTVSLEGYTFDVEKNQVIEIQGKTDIEGNYNFSFYLPEYITGSDLEGGMGYFYLQATVTDLVKHTEDSNLSLPISAQTLIIEAIPEGGFIRPGIENMLFILTSYPDGTPAETNLELTIYESGEKINIHTGAYGLAQMPFTPQNSWQDISIQAKDQQGNITQKEFNFEGEYQEESVLLRPEKPVYHVGEAMKLTILTSRPQGSVYLDIVRAGQTINTRSLEVNNGQAEAVIDLSADMYGTLVLHAYKILRSGIITRDTRLVIVDQSEDLRIDISSGEEVYRPGDSGRLNIHVKDSSDDDVKAALGIAIVDESVFSLAEQDPGFAKLYFMLEQELLQPKYDLHGFSVPDLVHGVPIDNDAMITAIEHTAQASMADVALHSFRSSSSTFSLQANSHQDAIQYAREMQQKYFEGLSKALYTLIFVLPLSVFSLTALSLWKEKRFWYCLALAVALVTLIVLVFFTWPLGGNYSWVEKPLDRIGIVYEWLTWGTGEVFLAYLTLLGSISFISLGVYSWKKKDTQLSWILFLSLVFLGSLLALLFASNQITINPSEGQIMLGLFAFSLLPFTFLLRSVGYSVKQSFIPALGAFLISMALLISPLPVLLLGESHLTNIQQADIGMMGGEMLVEEGLPMPAMELRLESPADEKSAGSGLKVEKEVGSEITTGAEPPRLRQYFPETMFWLPDAVTDENGELELDIPIADSITTWRITALASSQDGLLGSETSGLRVFQDFFIDLDLPSALTVGDEVAIPVGVFNYMEEPQDVRLELEQAPWFELLDESEKEIQIAANDISVVYFRVKATQFGNQPFKVTAWGSRMSDAIQKEVRIFPDGKPIQFTQSDRLSPDTPVQEIVNIPSQAIPGTQSLLVKIYPGILSQVVEGLDSILRMPYGCFEQTTSITYPNVLVLDYLKTTNQASPEAEMKAEEYINLGYQRLTTFEVQSSGGFSLFGDAPADRMLTAYGLMEFVDMSRVFEIDQALIQRAAEWLLSQQSGDGSWENDRGLVHENIWSNLGDDRLPVTAYITWSLVEAGYGSDSGVQMGLSYVRENQSKAGDAYVLALVANSFVAADLDSEGKLIPATETVLERLAGMASKDGNGVYWNSDIATFMGSEGKTSSIETTALAAFAFLKSGTYPDLGNGALTYLIQQKDSYGTWYNTQATVHSLKALLQSVRTGAENVNAHVMVSLNDGQTRSLQVTPENFDVVQLISFDDINLGRDNQIEITTEGDGNLMYQISGGYYLPWEVLANQAEHGKEQEPVSIQVTYDRTELSVNDTVKVEVTISLNQAGSQAESGLIDLGLPPGFSVQSEDLAALVAYFDDVSEDYPSPTIERYELTGRQILVYVSNLIYGTPLKFSYHLRAKFPLTAQTPASNVYDYYNPDVSGEVSPQLLVVKP